MTDFSRTKKNQKLYTDLHIDAEERITPKKPSTYQPRLSRSNHVSLEKDFSIDADIHDKETLKTGDVSLDVFDDDISNDLIQSFISEVKRYNIQSGLRSVEDTNMNILNELNKEMPLVNEKKQSSDLLFEPEKKEAESLTVDDDLELTKQNISSEIHKLLKGEYNPLDDYHDDAEHDQLKTTEISLNQEETLDNKSQATNDLSELPIKQENSVTKEDDLTQKLLEETQSLKLQLSEYENELSTINNDVNRSSKLLSLFVFILLLVVMVVVALVIYWVLMLKGVI